MKFRAPKPFLNALYEHEYIHHNVDYIQHAVINDGRNSRNQSENRSQSENRNQAANRNQPEVGNQPETKNQLDNLNFSESQSHFYNDMYSNQTMERELIMQAKLGQLPALPNNNKTIQQNVATQNQAVPSATEHSSNRPASLSLRGSNQNTPNSEIKQQHQHVPHQHHQQSLRNKMSVLEQLEPGHPGNGERTKVHQHTYDEAVKSFGDTYEAVLDEKNLDFRISKTKF